MSDYTWADVSAHEIFLAQTLNTANISVLTHTMVPARQWDNKSFDTWRAENPHLVDSAMLLRHSQGYTADLKKLLFFVEQRKDQPEVLICFKAHRAKYVRTITELLFNALLENPAVYKKLLLWWIAPSSSSAKATAWILLGQPDLTYVMHGLEDGFVPQKIKMKLLVAPGVASK
jgi:hypothetical protein